MRLARIGFNPETGRMIEIAVEKPALDAAAGARWLPALKAALLDAAARGGTLVASMDGAEPSAAFLEASFGALCADPAVPRAAIDATLVLRASAEDPLGGPGAAGVEAALRVMAAACAKRP